MTSQRVMLLSWKLWSPSLLNYEPAERRPREEDREYDFTKSYVT